MLLEFDINVAEAKGIVKDLDNNDILSTISTSTKMMLRRILDDIYSTISKREIENEEYREAIEKFLVIASSDDPETDPNLYVENN